jgi:SAM-dependent methyltransferase
MSGSSSCFLDPFIVGMLSEKDKCILDVGCGKGKWGFLLRTCWKPPSFSVGLDCDRQHVKLSKEHKVYDEIILGDGARLPFKNSSFDIVLAVDVLEVVNKREGYVILAECDRVAKERLIVATPNRSRLNIHAGHWWTPKDLKRQGFTVRGVGFAPYGSPISPRLTMALMPLAYYLPDFSYVILAWKNKGALKHI